MAQGSGFGSGKMNDLAFCGTTYVQDLSRCIDEGTIDADTRSELERELELSLNRLRREFYEGGHPCLEVAFRQDDLRPCEAAADILMDGAEDIVIFGTGGSSLGAQAISQAMMLTRSEKTLPRIHFFDNLETPWMERTLAKMDPRHTRYLVISKSGSTPEVLFQLIHALDSLKRAGLGDRANRHIVVLTEPTPETDNPLRAIAALHDLMVVDHHPGIGGRYSVLSSVGSLPAMLFGMDPMRIREGAASVLQPLLGGRDLDEVHPAKAAFTYLALEKRQPINSVVMMPYSSRLRLLAAWFQQLWAESLGKNGQGSQPVTAIGPVDQHSQLQLYLDGPDDKLYTIIMLNTRGRGLRMPKGYAHLPKLELLAGRTIGDMTDCQQRATAETLASRGRPVRTFFLDKVDERTLGALFMHFMLETILVGYMKGINPFDQPAVELSKNLTRKYMGEIPPQ